ncbi:MAG: outer membrane lipid asymmetry maintenance protein MlaD [Alphaproteobacteria bacterium]|jgi:phospholipid/cholesterol/gamma-HCH transport system substrate-binding protein
MMNKKPVETIMGIVVIFVAAFFLYFAYQVSDLQVVKGYDINARFLKVGGLNVGSDVRINGIKVGTVIAQNLDPEDYVADVKLSISSNIQLPKDSVVSVVSDGLVGNKFIKIEPGKSKEFLQNGDTVANTKDFKTLEDMVGEIIFMVTDNGDKK